MERLSRELSLKPETYRMFGRDIPSPRLVGWFGDKDASYKYSGVEHLPLAWTPSLSLIREQLQRETGLRFNGVLANLYRDQRDCMGWHSDDEPEVGPSQEDRWVASLSLGQKRSFLIRPKRGGPSTSFSLGEGDLLVMRGRTQCEFEHRLSRSQVEKGSRLNLTFRLLER